MTQKAFVTTGSILLVALATTGCGGGGKSGTVQINGSDTMVNLGQAWAEAYMAEHPEAKLAVTGGGSGTGIAALINGTTDIAQASRAMKDEEKQQAEQGEGSVVETQVAIDGLTVVVHPSNPVSKLTIAQLSDIFTGTVTNWNQVGGKNEEIFVLSRERNSGTHIFFLEEVLRRGNPDGSEEYAPGVAMLPSSQAIASEVAGNSASIGYFGLGYFDQSKHKAVAVARDSGGSYVSPGIETASSGEYPIARPLYFYTLGEPAGVAQKYIEFVLSDAGQRIVLDQEFVPLRSVPQP